MSMPKKISSEIIHQNPWWTYYHDKFAISDGREVDYYYGETTGGCSMIIPVLDDGRLILTIQHRYLRGKQSMEFPCGGLNAKEAPSQAAERELFEETGWKSTNIMKVGAFDGLNGLFKDTTHVFVASELEQIGEPQRDSAENIEIIYRRVDEFEEMLKLGEIWHGQTLAAWAIARDCVTHFIHN